MANLSRRTRWKKWAPDIGDNRELVEAWKAAGEEGPCPGLFLELAVDLTPAQLSDAAERLRETGDVSTMDEFRAEIRKAYVEAIGAYVRVHGGPHTVDGAALATFDDYLVLVTASAAAGTEHLRELMGALVAFNGIGRADELFSLPRSGGVRTTGARSNDAAASPTASP